MYMMIWRHTGQDRQVSECTRSISRRCFSSNVLNATHRQAYTRKYRHHCMDEGKSGDERSPAAALGRNNFYTPMTAMPRFLVTSQK